MKRWPRSPAAVSWVLRLLLVSAVVASTSGCSDAENLGNKPTDELITFLQESDTSGLDEDHCFVAYTLGERHAIEAVDALISVLPLGDDCVANALGVIGDVRAIEPLLGAFSGVEDPFLEDGNDVSRADDVLVAFGSVAVDPLLAVASSSEDQLELDRVANVLGRIRDPRAEAFLVDRLNDLSATLAERIAADPHAGNTDEITHSQEIAATALARIFSNQIDHLLPLLQAKGTATIAYGVIGLGQPGTEQALTDALSAFGDVTMAEFYLNANHPADTPWIIPERGLADPLRTAAEMWSLANGYEQPPWYPQPGVSVFEGYWGYLEDDPMTKEELLNPPTSRFHHLPAADPGTR